MEAAMVKSTGLMEQVLFTIPGCRRLNCAELLEILVALVLHTASSIYFIADLVGTVYILCVKFFVNRERNGSLSDLQRWEELDLLNKYSIYTYIKYHKVLSQHTVAENYARKKIVTALFPQYFGAAPTISTSTTPIWTVHLIRFLE